MLAKNYDDVKVINEATAKAESVQTVTFCHGLYNGYIIDLEPWYGISLLVYDNETKKLIYDNLGIHHQTYYLGCGEWRQATPEEQAETEIKEATASLFDINEITTTPPRDWYEQRKRADFVRNIYPKRYAYISAYYIGQPDEEQLKAKKERFISYSMFGYFKTEEQARDVDRCIRAVREQHEKRLTDVDYLAEAMLTEFYNYECMYSDRYDEALDSVGVDIDRLTAVQEQAFNVALIKFKQQLRERDY